MKRQVISVAILLLLVFSFIPFSDALLDIKPTNAFTIINMTGGNVTAQTSYDYVTFVAGTGVTITPNYDFQTITFTAGAGGLSTQYCTSTDKFSAYNATLGAFICTADVGAGGGEVNDGVNIGTGEASIFAGKLVLDLQFKTLLEGTRISLANNTNDVTISTTAELNTASNVGTGLGVYDGKTSEDLEFNSLIGGQGIDIVDTTQDLTIATDFKVNDITCASDDKISSYNNVTGVFTCTSDTDTDTGQTNTASNLGTGLGWYNTKVGSDLQFNSIIGGNGIDVTDTTDDITVDVTANSIDDNELGTGIDTIQLADGTVTEAEFQFINTLSSNAQDQLDLKLADITGESIHDLINVTSTGCATGEVLKVSGTNWICASDDDSGATPHDIIIEGDSSVEVIDAGSGTVEIDIDGTNVVFIDSNSLDLNAANINFDTDRSIFWALDSNRRISNFADGFVLEVGTDDDYSYLIQNVEEYNLNSTHFDINNNQIKGSMTCSDTEIIIYNSTSDVWECGTNGSGSQTPWLQNVNASNFSLFDVYSVNITSTANGDTPKINFWNQDSTPTDNMEVADMVFYGLNDVDATPQEYGRITVGTANVTQGLESGDMTFTLVEDGVDRDWLQYSAYDNTATFIADFFQLYEVGNNANPEFVIWADDFTPTDDTENGKLTFFGRDDIGYSYYSEIQSKTGDVTSGTLSGMLELSVSEDAVMTPYITLNGENEIIQIKDAIPLQWGSNADKRLEVDGAGMELEVPTTDYFDFEVASTSEYTLNATHFNINDNQIEGSMTCTNGQILEYNSATDVWDCGTNGSGSQTPWLQDVDANDFSLYDIYAIISNATDPANTGTIRLGYEEKISWRDNANGTDYSLRVGTDSGGSNNKFILDHAVRIESNQQRGFQIHRTGDLNNGTSIGNNLFAAEDGLGVVQNYARYKGIMVSDVDEFEEGGMTFSVMQNGTTNQQYILLNDEGLHQIDMLRNVDMNTNQIQGNMTCNNTEIIIYNSTSDVWDCGANGSGSQTPWTSDIDGADFSLFDVYPIISNATDPADTGFIRMGNAEQIAWEDDPTGTDGTLEFTSGGRFEFSKHIQINNLDGSGDIYTFRDDSTPTNFDQIGTVTFQANDDTLATTTYGRLRVQSPDVTDGNEDGGFVFDIMRDGTVSTGLAMKGQNSELELGTDWNLDILHNDIDNVYTLFSNASNTADAGTIRLGNAESIAWESSPAGTDGTLTFDASENFDFNSDIEILKDEDVANFFMKSFRAIPSNFDAIGTIYYDGENDIGQNVNYGRMRVSAPDITDTTEDGQYLFDVMTGGVLTNMLGLNVASDGMVSVTTDFELNGNDIIAIDSLFIDEKASADADVGGDGQLWIKNDAPNSLYFTDDTGIDVKLGYPDIAHVTNSDVNSTNINTATWTAIPLNGNSEFLDTDSFSISGSGVQCDYNGRVKVESSVHMVSTGARVSIQIQPFINGVGMGEIGSGGYIRATSGHNEASTFVSAIDTCVNGQVIDIRGQRESTLTTSTTMPQDGSSYLTLERMG